MFKNGSLRNLVLVWLAWSLILIAYQELVPARFSPQRPDGVLQWTPNETGARSQNNKPYLLNPFLNTHVSWDSEFYLAIAAGGFDDPAVRSILGPGYLPLSLSYAFFPLYPVLIRYLAIVPGWFGLSPVPAATLAGVLISLLGALAGMIALYYLARQTFGETGAQRAAYYLLIFPTGFFLAQVYTEGLFVGLAFSALALIQYKKLGWAALLAILATWTRAVGALLVIPLALAAWQDWSQTPDKKLFGLPALQTALSVAAPVAAYGAWSFSFLGSKFRFVEAYFFGRGFLEISRSIDGWRQALTSIFGQNTQTSVYYIIEFSLILLALATSLVLLKRMPGVALFSLAVLVISLFSGSPQSLNRYVLTCPAIFLSLGWLGKHEAFDRSWTVASILLMGLLAALFSFDFWVG